MPQKNTLGDVTQIRLAFVERVAAGLADVGRSGLEMLTQLEASQPKRSEGAVDLAYGLLRLHCTPWLQLAGTHWLHSLDAMELPLDESPHWDVLDIQLQTDEMAYFRVATARMAKTMLADLPDAYNELRIRILHVEGGPDLLKDDPFNPEVLSRACITAWKEVGLTLQDWGYCSGLFQEGFKNLLGSACQEANQAMIRQGILPRIDLRTLVKRTPDTMPVIHAGLSAKRAHNQPDFVDTKPSAILPLADRAVRIRLASQHQSTHALGLTTPSKAGQASAQSPASEPQAASVASAVPARMKDKAHEMVQQLVAILHERVGFDTTRPYSHTTARMSLVRTDAADTVLRIPDLASPSEALEALKEHSAAFKKKVHSKQEKATTEIVALMFQSILAEESLSATVRLLIARLQMPVMRVAMENLEFFNSESHPARKLIDRMGTCVLGLDPKSPQCLAIEAELGRIVQMVEQFPDTGLKIFEVALHELDQFIRRQLDIREDKRVTSFVQQIEQRAAYSVQYTLEIRELLREFDIDPFIEEFLLKHWADVLAACSVRHGRNDPVTLAAKETAAQMVWSAGPKPTKADRMKMMTQLPSLLHNIREGLRMLAWKPAAIEDHVRKIAHAIGSSLVKQAGPVSDSRLSQMRNQLQNLESQFSDSNLGDLPFNHEEIELLLEMDGLDVHVINDLPLEPSGQARAWAHELDAGAWYTIKYRNVTAQAQYQWSSDLKQLHLFANPGHKDILIADKSLAAYLQAGLIRPVDPESLSVRATRKALSEIHNNPERLLQ